MDMNNDYYRMRFSRGFSDSVPAFSRNNLRIAGSLRLEVRRAVRLVSRGGLTGGLQSIQDGWQSQAVGKCAMALDDLCSVVRIDLLQEPAEPVVRDAWDEVMGDVHVLAVDEEAPAVRRTAVFGNSRLPTPSIRGVLSDPGVPFACDDPSITIASLRTHPFMKAQCWHGIGDDGVWQRFKTDWGMAALKRATMTIPRRSAPVPQVGSCAYPMSGRRVRSRPAITNGRHRPGEANAWCEGSADFDPVLFGAQTGPCIRIGTEPRSRVVVVTLRFAHRWRVSLNYIERSFSTRWPTSS
jgi:hypothetical protein